MAQTIVCGFIDGSTRTYSADGADPGNPTSLVLINAVLLSSTPPPLLGGSAVIGILAVPPLVPGGQVLYGIGVHQLTSWTIQEQP